MNSLIEEIFENFKVDGNDVPVAFLRYTGKLTTFVTYQEIQTDTSFSAENEIQNYVSYYDFDFYSKGNYLKIIQSVKELLKQNGFLWQPSMTSQDLYEDDTGYFHKTLCFAYVRSEEEIING